MLPFPAVSDTELIYFASHMLVDSSNTKNFNFSEITWNLFQW